MPDITDPLSKAEIYAMIQDAGSFRALGQALGINTSTVTRWAGEEIPCARHYRHALDDLLGINSVRRGHLCQMAPKWQWLTYSEYTIDSWAIWSSGDAPEWTLEDWGRSLGTARSIGGLLALPETVGDRGLWKRERNMWIPQKVSK